MSLLRYPPMKEQLWRYGDMTAEELIQEVATDVYKHWDESWDDALVRFVTSRRLIDIYRKRQKKVWTQCDLEDWNTPLYEMDGLDDLLDMRSRWAKLSDTDRKVISLTVEGCSYQEIGDHLGISRSAAGDRLYRLRLMLSGKAPIHTNKRR